MNNSNTSLRTCCRALLLITAVALASLPLRVSANLDQARQLAAAGKVDEALAQVDGLLANDPKNIAARLVRGVLLSEKGQTDEAIDTFSRIAEEKPDLPEPHNNLAVLYAAQSRYDKALDALQRAIELQPDYDVAQENLGDVYVKLASIAYARAQQINAGNERAAKKAVATDNLLEPTSPSSSSAPSRPPPRRQASKRKSPPATPVVTTPRAVPQAPASTPAVAVARSCVTIPNITPAARAKQVRQWLEEQGMRTTVTQSASRSGSATPAAEPRRQFMVVVPPKGGREQAEKRAGELRANGIEDLIILTRGELAAAISLGVYNTRKSAQLRQTDLARKDVQTTIIERPTTSRTTNRAATKSGSTSIQARGQFSAEQFASAFADLTFDINDCR